ncbi:hypothetical protein RI844_03030 [Thalassotalea fonticola]|uniref:Uncharacterized protein n=1 Tax=Thalassotalea fonticola TaxID=3065649 RepID=A0ABZ0GS54_9GAMM|nr:hypothetical protein RI844_03030 [Colwelliaceae bacterium S1-1]
MKKPEMPRKMLASLFNFCRFDSSTHEAILVPNVDGNGLLIAQSRP